MLNSSLLTFESVNWLYTLNDLFCLSSERIFCLWLKRGQSLRKWAYTYPPLCIYTFFLVKSSWVFFVCLRVFGVGFLFGWFFWVLFMSLYTEKYFLYDQRAAFWIVFGVDQPLKERDLILYQKNPRKWEKVFIRGLERQSNVYSVQLEHATWGSKR